MNTTQVDSTALDRNAPDEPEELSLVDGPAPDRDAWVAAVDQVLRRARRLDEAAAPGAGVEALTWSTPDGITVQPLYTAADVVDLPDVGVPGLRPFVRGDRPGGAVPDGWDVRQWHADPNPTAAREAILTDLANGAASIWLAVGPGGTAGTAVADLPAVLDGVLLDLAPVVLDASGSGPDDAAAAAEAYLELGAARVDPSLLRGTLGLDPVGVRARTGSGPDVGSVVPLALRASREFPHVHAVVADGLPVHVAGGSAGQELGYLLAAGVAYLRALTGAGLDVDAAARLVELRVAATADQFPTIAKIRAARRLWSRVLEASGAAPGTAPTVHAVASPTMYTRRDPYVNLLRGTVAGFAAGVGGADAVTVAPFDAALGASTPFSRRIARNTQSLLIMEAHLARVIDPAGGSWYAETLTDGLARGAWAFFQELEAAGGAVAALDSGLVAERVAAVRAAGEADVATRRTPLTGVSEFPDLHEKPVLRSGTDLLAGLGVRAGGLPVHRPAAAFEALRDRSDAVLAATGTRPTAFLATLGPLAAYAARAGFARNLLHAGGIDAVEAGPTQTVDEVAAAFREAGTPVAVLCAPDGLYAERAAPVVAALRAAGARHVLLAGKARVDGLDGRLYTGVDALAVLHGIYAVLDPQEDMR
ncbi:methylmalonyl-CoA mutase family protein [Pseudonocardia charpentierae]|uniref:Methylmalonyl-CoA mutase family protein n=1 Tax=Pseudonocardia charpentierae TaxID=3075545 RepID=A0ABU2N676_9PSEU|nr:methylmalonyl-CoA mutase family protein [Pseudonocardia sp. DSM 45834]MDT0349384.1 methylmalonyl-CoA mutase family protein [Pseudonocardia sp. DSM 45834]